MQAKPCFFWDLVSSVERLFFFSADSSGKRLPPFPQHPCPSPFCLVCNARPCCVPRVPSSQAPVLYFYLRYWSLQLNKGEQASSPAPCTHTTRDQEASHFHISTLEQFHALTRRVPNLHRRNKSCPSIHQPIEDAWKDFALLNSRMASCHMKMMLSRVGVSLLVLSFFLFFL